MCPRFSQYGDEVHVFPGLSVPFVMQRHEEYYELVGPCFILGFMDGEAQERPENTDISIQDIEIR